MLTQGPAPDPKCELNITSLLTLPHPLHDPICAKDIMVTFWGEWFIYLRVWVGGQGVGFIFFVFVLLLIVLSWLVHDSLFCLFHCSFFALFVSGPLN